MKSKVYEIDLNTRAVKVPAGEVIGVYHDKDVNRLTFEVPAMYKGIDLTEYQISINYVNEEEQKDVYFIENYTLSDDASTITFDWLVGATACTVPGSIGFTICFKKLDDDGSILNEINTKLTRMKVLEGCEAVEGEIEERYMTDLAGQLYKEMEEVKKSVSDGKMKVASAITDKGVDTEATDTFDSMAENVKKISSGGNFGMIVNTSPYIHPHGCVANLYGLLGTEVN